MNKLYNLLILFSSMLGFFACQPSTTTDSEIPTLSFDKIDKEKSISMSELAKSGKFIELESKRESYVQFITDSYVGRDYIIIADNETQKVSQYKNDGSFIRNIGSVGKGPGEFNGPSICVNEKDNLILILSPSLGRINVYNFDGELIRDIQTNDLLPYAMIDVMEFVRQNLVFVLRRPVIDTEDFYQIWYFDSDLNFLSKHKHIPDLEGTGWEMQEPIRYKRYLNGLVYFDFYGDTLFFVGEDEKIKPLFILDYGRMPTSIAQKPGAFDKYLEYNSIVGFTSIPPYILLSWRETNNNSKTIFYNLDTHEKGILKEISCPTNLNGRGILNDITGVNPFYGGQYNSNGYMSRIIARWIIDGYVKPECIKEMSEAYPKMMKEFKNVFSPEKIGNNPVIEVIELR